MAEQDQQPHEHEQSEPTPDEAASAPEPTATPAEPSNDDARPFELPTLDGARGGAPSEIDLLSDVKLHVKIELGRTRMLVEDVLRLSEGCVVELDKLAGDPVDVYVNERLIARGEILVLNESFCVRVNEIVAEEVEKARKSA